MAPSTGAVRPARSLVIFGLIVAALYALVFFTGDKSPTPKLGIDLQGGTRVTLTARTPDGSKPSQDSLRRAQEIIETRVNGLGVSGSEVVIDGDNLVITVPGDDSSQARTLGQTARLYIRPVQSSAVSSNAQAQAPKAETPAPAPAPQNRPFPAQEPGTPAPPTETPAPPRSRARHRPTIRRPRRSPRRRRPGRARTRRCSSRRWRRSTATPVTRCRATTIRRCRWWPARRTAPRSISSGRASSTARRSRTRPLPSTRSSPATRCR
ncbi:secD/SecF GG Motif family protein [Rhodococcus sp. MTM3W5.2]|nr:secD/SecF GG Motif family protein [Rhodococcus sp. MTM3W5.2]